MSGRRSERSSSDPLEKLENSAREQRGRRRVVRRQGAVGEVVLIARVQEQLGVRNGGSDLARGVDVALTREDRVVLHAVDLYGDALGPRAERPFARDRD